MAVLVQYIGNVLVIWAAVYLGERYRVSARLLRGLHYYKLLQQPEALPAAKDTPRGSTARARRSEARRLTPQPDMGPGLEQLARLNLTAAGIASDDHYSDFNTMVLLCLATAGNYLVDAAGSLLLSREASLVPTVMSLMTIGLALYLLVKVQLLSKTDSISDKTMVAGMGALCAGLAAIAIRRVPTAILHFDTSTAASQLSLGLTKSMQSMEVPSEDIVSHEVSEVWVDARMMDSVLSVVAGVLSGMLLPPCMRAGRGLRQAFFTPGWGGTPLTTSAVNRLLLLLSIVLPGLTCLLWVGPIIERSQLAGAKSLVFARGSLLLACGLVLAACLRQQVQTYLNLAVLHWHEKKDLAAEASATERVTRVINVTNEIIRRLACKVALQCLAPCAIMLASGAGLLYLATGAGEMTVEQMDSYRGLQVPPIVLQVILDFIGFWTCNVYFMFMLSTAIVDGGNTDLT